MKKIEVAAIEPRQHGVRLTGWLAVARYDVKERLSFATALGAQKVRQPTEARNRPVIGRGGNRRLQQDFDGAIHGALGIVEPLGHGKTVHGA